MDDVMVSIIMPVYNAEKYVEEAIKSVIEQTYSNWELVIIDDCSTDSSMKIVHNFKDSRIRIFYNEKNHGISYSRNRALSMSRGKYIAIMDDDDISMPTRLEKQVIYLETHDEVGVLGGNYDWIDEQGNVVKRISGAFKNPRYIRARLLFQNIFCNGEVMYRNSIIQQYNIKYCNEQYGLEDFRLWVDCAKITTITSIEDVLFQHRFHEQNETLRAMKDNRMERNACYSNIQTLSLMNSGFHLSEEEIKVFTYYFVEGPILCKDAEDFIKIFNILKKIVQQARESDMDNCKEIDIICKQKMYQALRNCENFFEYHLNYL
jgi:Glycosyltransferases involved in cell wall biogenesis